MESARGPEVHIAIVGNLIFAVVQNFGEVPVPLKMKRLCDMLVMLSASVCSAHTLRAVLSSPPAEGHLAYQDRRVHVPPCSR